MKNQTVCVVTGDACLSQLDELSAANDLNRSQYIRKLIRREHAKLKAQRDNQKSATEFYSK